MIKNTSDTQAEITTLLIAGGRDLLDHMSQKEAFYKLSTALMANFKITETEQIGRVIHGGAKGADITGGDWAKTLGIQCRPEDVYLADWKNLDVTPCKVKYNSYGAYNALAGYNRNTLMRHQATHAVIFWNSRSRGTKDMIAKLKEADIPHVIIDY